MNAARFNGAANEDNTERKLKRGYIALAVYAATLTIATQAGYSPQNGFHLVKPAILTGALSVVGPVGTSTTPPMIGDQLSFIFAADGTDRIVTFGAGFASTGTLTVAASKKATAAFIFDGAAWVEQGRSITA